MTDALRGPEAGGVGVRTSDEVLALAAPALDFFARWAEIWNAVAPSKIDVGQDIRQKFQDSAGLDFHKFLADADALARAHETLDATHADATNTVTTLFRDWQGPAATTAQGAYNRLHPEDLLDHLDGAAQLIPETMTHVFTALKTKVDEALKLRTESVAGAPLPVAQRIVAVARGEDVSQDELLDLARWLDSASPGNALHDRLRDCEPGDNDYATRAARHWLNGPFATEFGSRYAAFQGLCAAATAAIDGHFRTLSGFLAVSDRTSTVGSRVDVPTPALGLPAVQAEFDVDPVSGSTSGDLAVPGDSTTASAGDLAGPGSTTTSVEDLAGRHGALASAGNPPGPGSTTASAGDLAGPGSATASAGDLDVPDDSTTAAASLSDLGAHIVDPPPDQHPSAELGTAPGGDVTFDPLGPGTDSLPDGMSGFGPLNLPGLGTLGAAPGDPPRPAARLGADVFDTRGSAGRISGSLDDGPGVERR